MRAALTSPTPGEDTLAHTKSPGWSSGFTHISTAPLLIVTRLQNHLLSPHPQYFLTGTQIKVSTYESQQICFSESDLVEGTYPGHVMVKSATRKKNML